MIAEDLAAIQRRIDTVAALNGVPDRGEVERWCDELARLEVLATNLSSGQHVIALVRLYTSQSTLVGDVHTTLEGLTEP